MKTIANPTQAALARALGIDPALVSRYKARGMPVTSIADATAWRDANVRVRMKADGDYEAISRALQGEDCVKTLGALAQAAGELLDAGGDGSPLVPALRAAFAAVPYGQRERVLAPFNVLDMLTEEVAEVLDRGDPDGLVVGALPQVHTGAGRDFDMGAFWYAVAAGEIRLNTRRR